MFLDERERRPHRPIDTGRDRAVRSSRPAAIAPSPGPGRRVPRERRNPPDEAGFTSTATGIRSPATDPHEPPSEAKSGLGRGLFLLLGSLIRATPGDPARLGAIRRDPCAHAPTVRP